MATATTNLSEYDKKSLPFAKNFKIGIVTSQWNSEITSALTQGAQQTLLECGVQEENILQWEVPGSFELVFGCKKMMDKSLDAIIAIGSVIQGETKHFDFVCNAVSHGIKDLNLDNEFDTPVIFCVLTDDTLQQARDRSGGKHGNKGVEAAVAAIKMAQLREF